MQFRPRKNGFRLPGLKPGASTQRLKPRSLGGALTARLKSCPDTQPTTSDSQEKNAISAEEEWIRLSRAEAQSVLRRFLAGLKPGASTQRLKPRSLGARLRHDSSRALTRSPQRRRSQVHATGAGGSEPGSRPIGSVRFPKFRLQNLRLLPRPYHLHWQNPKKHQEPHR